MAPLDLGLVTLRIRDSQLHLRLKATAHINRLEKDKEAEEQESPSQLHDSSNFWITEAPEIELRFLFFSRNWTLKDAVDTLVSGLGDKLCGLKVCLQSVQWVLVFILLLSDLARPWILGWD
jgi:hypothetical protein